MSEFPYTEPTSEYIQGYQIGFEDGKTDGVREFAEWLCKSNYRCIEDLGFRTNIFDISNIYSINAVLSEYEKEQKE